MVSPAPTAADFSKSRLCMMWSPLNGAAPLGRIATGYRRQKYHGSPEEARVEPSSMAHSKRKENGKISCAMNDADYLNRLRLPDVGHYIRVEVPEAILPAEELVMVTVSYTHLRAHETRHDL